MFDGLINAVQDFWDDVKIDDFCVPCFLKGLARGAAIGLTALLVIASLPAAAATAVTAVLVVAGVAGAAVLAARWGNMSDGQRSEALGDIVGGLLAGGFSMVKPPPGITLLSMAASDGSTILVPVLTTGAAAPAAGAGAAAAGDSVLMSEGGSSEESPEQKRERLREAQKRRIAERERQQKLDESIDKADAKRAKDAAKPMDPEKRKKFDEDQSWLDQDRRHKELAIDPDGNGNYRVEEGKAALQAEDEGVLTKPVRRATEAASPEEKGGDFVDGDNQVWDHKSASMGADDIAETAQHENVLVDARNMTPEEQANLQQAVDQKLSNTPDASQVRFVPRR